MPRRRTRSAPTPALLALLALAPLARAETRASDFRDWQSRHAQAVAGDAAALASLSADLETALAKDPANALARVYLGSTWTLKSRVAPVGPGKLEALQRGGRLMDDAVAAAPDDPRVRLVRAVNAFELPKIFNRRKIALADFEALTRPPLQTATDALPPEERQAVYWFAGRAFADAKRGSDARAAWTAALDAAPTSPLAPEIRRALDKLSK